MDFGFFKAITFDCYGTLIDWEKGIGDLIAPWLASVAPSVPADLALSAFALMQAKHQQVRPALLYPEVLRRTWRDMERTFGWDRDDDHADMFARSVSAWPPFGDTVQSLHVLSRSYRLAILSNVDNESLKGTLVGLEVPFEFTVTAEDVGSYKPGLPHFRKAIEEFERRGIPQQQVLHVAQSKHHDVKPARELGLASVWVNRRHGKKGSGATLATEAEPDITVASLKALVGLMGVD